MSDHGSHQPRPAYCEDVNEETQTTVPETRQCADVSAKSDVGRAKIIRDEQSDSGYSSHTHSAPNSSLDSKVEVTQSNAANPSVNEVPVQPKKLSASRAQSPEKDAIKRVGSKGRRDAPSRKKECQCDKCIHDARRAGIPYDAYRPQNYAIAQQRQRTPAPPSPQARRMPPPEIMLPPPQPRPRAATTSRARPISFHGGVMPEPMYMAQPTYVVERPPSARQAAYPFPPPSYPPHPAFLQAAPPPPPPPQPPPPPPPPREYFVPVPMEYEVAPPPQPRPRPRKWSSEQGRPRPQTMFYSSPPILEYAEPRHRTPEPSSQPIHRQISRRSRRESLREPYPAPEEDTRRMPPPPPPPPAPVPRLDTRVRPEQRPTIQQAARTQSAHPDLHIRGGASQASASPVKSRNPHKEAYGEENRSRRPSLARPSKTSDEKVVSFDELERGMKRVDLEPGRTKSRRRSSVYGHESLQDLEGSIEAYQQSKGNIRPNEGAGPTHEDVARLVRKRTTTESEAGSRASAHSRGSRGSRGSREGSDSKSSKALDRRPSNDVNARSENDRFALKFNPEGINVKMQGGMEGHAINLRKSKEGDGDMELSIGSRASIESVRGRHGSTSRPPQREKSRKRYSVVEGQAVKEIAATGFDTSRSASMARVNSREEAVPRIIGERIITTTRSRRSSRYGYDGQERYQRPLR